jgi:hypothetical protein
MSDDRVISVTTKLVGNTSFRVERYLTTERHKGVKASMVKQRVKVKDVAPNPFKRGDDG